MEMKKTRPSQGLIDMMNDQWEQTQEENMKSFSTEPVYKDDNVMRSISEIEERLECALIGLEHARESDNFEIMKKYKYQASTLFWVLGRSGRYEYKDGKIILKP